MAIFKTIVASLAAVGIVNAYAAPRMRPIEERMAKMQPKRFPEWNYANQTTADATADGRVGVILEPDLVPGKPGKDGATVRKIKVGTYTIPASTTQELPVPRFELPCTNCYITAFQLGLEYPNGKVANVDTGAWCHHIDLTIPGKDYTCPSSWATLLTFSDPAMGAERIFSGGNERVPYRLNTKSKYGIWLGSDAHFGGVLELMNERKSEPITVIMTMTFETVPGSSSGYKKARMIWLDVTNCGHQSDFPAQTGKYQLASKEFNIDGDGEWLNAIGHEHDGGTQVELFQNGKLICTSKQMYGNKGAAYEEPNDGSIASVYMMGKDAHISDVGLCKNFGTVKKGDKVSMKAYYDDSQHMQMKTPRGSLELQMGILFGYIGFY